MVSADDVFTGIGFVIVFVIIMAVVVLYAYSYYSIATGRKKLTARERNMLTASTLVR